MDEIARMVPGLRVDDLRGGSFCPSDGIAGPSEMTQGYAHGARQLGVQILEAVEVVGLSINPGQCRVRTDRGEIRAGRVVCCAGAWSRAIGEMASGVAGTLRPWRCNSQSIMRRATALGFLPPSSELVFS